MSSLLVYLILEVFDVDLFYNVGFNKCSEGRIYDHFEKQVFISDYSSPLPILIATHKGVMAVIPLMIIPEYIRYSKITNVTLKVSKVCGRDGVALSFELAKLSVHPGPYTMRHIQEPRSVILVPYVNMMDDLADFQAPHTRLTSPVVVTTDGVYHVLQDRVIDGGAEADTPDQTCIRTMLTEDEVRSFYGKIKAVRISDVKYFDNIGDYLIEFANVQNAKMPGPVLTIKVPTPKPE